MNSEEFAKKLKEGLKLKELKSIAWHVVGESPQFKPEKTLVRLEDVEGIVFEMVIHEEPWLTSWKGQEMVLLNVILAHRGIVPVGKWLGFNWDISEAVNHCRKKIPYNGVFWINEERCQSSDFVTPEYIF